MRGRKLCKEITDSGVLTDLPPDADNGKDSTLHPAHTGMAAADKRAAREAKFDKTTGMQSIPARSAIVFVENE